MVTAVAIPPSARREKIEKIAETITRSFNSKKGTFGIEHQATWHINPDNTVSMSYFSDNKERVLAKIEWVSSQNKISVTLFLYSFPDYRNTAIEMEPNGSLGKKGEEQEYGRRLLIIRSLLDKFEGILTNAFGEEAGEGVSCTLKYDIPVREKPAF